MATTKPPTFGILLRQHRVEAEMTQEQLAERARISVRAVSDLERGVKHTPRMHTVRQLADALALEGQERACFTAAARGTGQQIPSSHAQEPAPSSSSRADNLPHLLTRFIGRQQELAEARRCLENGHLLTLTGAGGSGKTRLALEVAAALRASFPDGVRLVELASLRSEGLVAASVAATLNIAEEPGTPLLQTLQAQLESRSLLLILDNCEHVLDAAAHLVGALLRHCPRVRILATSREPLRIPGEMVRSVPPLAVPEPEQVPSIESLRGYASIQLLVDRVRYRVPEFRLTEGNVRACAHIARRLEGLPLAIELAAARVGPLSIEQIAALLDESLGVLALGSRIAEPRQQTMRGALDWSYHLLNGEEKRLFVRLSVFAGGWTLEGAQVIGSTEHNSGGEVLGQLSHLIDQSLVLAETRPDGSVRYRMLEPVRQYARERLQESGEADAVQRRHAELLLTLAEAAEPELAGPNQEAWLQRLWTEADNTRAALLWARGERGDPALGLRLASRFSRLLLHRGDLREAREWLETLLARAEHADVAVRARALQRAGVLAANMADTAAATTFYEAALAMFQALGDDLSIGWTLAYLSNLQRQSGDPHLRIELMERALVIAREVKDQRLTATALNDLASSTEDEGKLDRASALREEARSIFRTMGNHLMEGIAVFNMAMMENRHGNHERALPLCHEALSIFVGLRDRRMIGHALDGFGAIAYTQGNPPRAVRLFAAARALRESCGAQTDPVFYGPIVQMLEGARQSLGETGFSTEWSAGSAMPLEAALDYVAIGLPADAVRADAVG